MKARKETGEVVAVCMSPNHGFPTHPQSKVYVGEWGIPGDAHAGPLRESFRNPGTFKINDRPILVMPQEIVDEMNQRFGLAMKPGDFNEQVVVKGLGDLGDVLPGSRLRFSSGLELEVVEQATPCTRLEKHNGAQNGDLINALTVKRGGEIFYRRGLLTRVIQPAELSPRARVQIRRFIPQAL